MANTLQIKRGTTANRLAYKAAVAEPVLDITTGELFVGDGVTNGGKPVITSWTNWYMTVATASTTVDVGTTFKKADVYVEGSMQTPGYHYSVSGSIITFGESIKSGSHVYVKLYK